LHFEQQRDDPGGVGSPKHMLLATAAFDFEGGDTCGPEAILGLIAQGLPGKIESRTQRLNMRSFADGCCLGRGLLLACMGICWRVIAATSA